MPAPSLATDAFILLKRPPADAFQTLTVFSAEHGALLVIQRVPRPSARRAAAPSKAPTAIALDLFDEASVILESSNQGRTWFVKETRLLTRHADIGRSYDALCAASALAALVARNPVHEDTRAGVATLLRTAFAAFATGAPPDIVYFKGLYCFARDEGYPLKQQWFPTLPADLRTGAARLLNTPLARLESSPGENQKTRILQRRLEDYLRSHTEILLD